MERGGVLSRLRTVVPAGTTPTRGESVIGRMSLGHGAGRRARARRRRGRSASGLPAGVGVRARRTPPRRAEPRPPEAWLQGDPADSLYRAAREALDRRDYRRAADLFAQVPARFPRSGYAADAYYWRAFSLYRLGGTPQLRRALAGARYAARPLPQGRHQGRRQGAGAAGSRASSPGRAIPTRRPRSPTAADASRRRAASRRCRRCRRPRRRRPTPPTPPVRRRRATIGCSDDDDDTKLAALNALHADGRRARPADPPAGARAPRRGLGLPAAEGGLPDRRRRAPPAPRTSCSSPRATIPTTKCGSRRCSGCRRWAPTERSARSIRSSGPRRIRALQEKAVFALSQHGSARASQALRTYAERPDLPADLREKAIFWIGQSGGAENEAFLRALYGRLKERVAPEEGAVLALAGRRPGERALAARRGARRDAAASSCASRRCSGRARATRRMADLAACTPPCPTARCASS